LAQARGTAQGLGGVLLAVGRPLTVRTIKAQGRWFCYYLVRSSMGAFGRNGSKQCAACHWWQPKHHSWCGGCQQQFPPSAKVVRPSAWQVAYPAGHVAPKPQKRNQKKQQPEGEVPYSAALATQDVMECIPNDIDPAMRVRIEANLQAKSVVLPTELGAPSVRALAKAKDKLARLQKESEAAASTLEEAIQSYEASVTKVLDMQAKVDTMSAEFVASQPSASSGQPAGDELKHQIAQQMLVQLAKHLQDSANIKPEVKQIVAGFLELAGPLVAPPMPVPPPGGAVGAGGGGGAAEQPTPQAAEAAQPSDADASMDDPTAAATVKRQRLHDEVVSTWKRNRASSPAAPTSASKSVQGGLASS
jgi:hypothetical protein